MRIEASFVTSAATARDFPERGLREIALVGRSNVGKSSLINALVRQKVARTSAAPGKTRLANFYRVVRGSGDPLYLVDFPGYGYARGDADAFDELVRSYFGAVRLKADATVGRSVRLQPDVAALLLIDSRHPGLPSDIEAWHWLRSSVERAAIVATKIDKLSRAERLRAIRTNEAVFEHSVLPCSAVTGEGLEELWKLIDRLANSSNRRTRRPPQPPKK